MTWEEYVKEVRTLEESIGRYADWPIAEKEKLIKALVDMGHIRESAATTALVESSISDEGKHALADQIMLRFLGGDSNSQVSKEGIGAIYWDSITTAIMGKPSTWTYRERAWHQQVTNMFGSEDADILVLPSDGDLPEKDAVAIARAEIIKVNGLSEDALDGFLPNTVLYEDNVNVLGENAKPEFRRWRVNFIHYQYGQEDGRTLVQSYEAIVGMDGSVETNKKH